MWTVGLQAESTRCGMWDYKQRVQGVDCGTTNREYNVWTVGLQAEYKVWTVGLQRVQGVDCGTTSREYKVLTV